MATRFPTPLALTALLTLTLAGCRGLAPDTEVGRAAAAGGTADLTSLLEKGANPNQLDGSGVAPLHIAARLGRVESIEALLKAGAQVDLRDQRNGWTPLMHAIHKRRSAAVVALLDDGADANGRDGYPLVMAAGYGDTESVRLLLAKGADPMRYPRPRAQSALWAAVGGGAIIDITDGPPFGSCFPDTVQALLERAPDLKLVEGAPMTRLVRLLGRGKKCEEAFALIERGAAAQRSASGS